MSRMFTNRHEIFSQVLAPGNPVHILALAASQFGACRCWAAPVASSVSVADAAASARMSSNCTCLRAPARLSSSTALRWALGKLRSVWRRPPSASFSWSWHLRWRRKWRALIDDNNLMLTRARHAPSTPQLRQTTVQRSLRRWPKHLGWFYRFSPVLVPCRRRAQQFDHWVRLLVRLPLAGDLSLYGVTNGSRESPTLVANKSSNEPQNSEDELGTSCDEFAVCIFMSHSNRWLIVYSNHYITLEQATFFCCAALNHLKHILWAGKNNKKKVWIFRSAHKTHSVCLFSICRVFLDESDFPSLNIDVAQNKAQHAFSIEKFCK